MDLRFSPEIEQFRAEVRDFLVKECPPQYCFETDFDEDDDRWAFAFDLNRKIGQKRWIGVNWPMEYGGLGKPPIYRAIFMEEVDLHGAPLLNAIGWGLAAGSLLRYGSEEQKQRFLPPIVKQERYWAEGLTEPDSGSDLASLKTTAVRDGDDWVINGQKTFTTWGHRMEVLYLAARTDPNVPKHKGITIFCLDLKSRGVSMQPMMNMAGGRQNHTFLDNVRVPNDMMVGEMNQGWQCIMNAFYGGGGGGGAGKLRRVFGRLVEYCKETKRNGKPMSQDPVIRLKLTDLAIRLETLKMIGWDGLYRLEHQAPPQFGGALGVVVYKEFFPYFGQTCMEILGPLAQLQEGGKWAPLAGEVEHVFRQSYGNHAGGTSQVKRMVLATRGLGLPRG